MTNFNTKISFLALAVLFMPFLAACGSQGDQIQLSCKTEGGVRVGDVLKFELERNVNDGTVYRTYQVDNYEILFQPAGAVKFDKQNKTLTIMRPGDIEFWVEAIVAPVDIQKPFANWTSKELKSNVVSFESS